MLRAPSTAVAALAALLLFAGLSSPGSGDGRARAQQPALEQAARELFADPDIQFELPGSGTAERDGSKSWSTWSKSWSLSAEERSDLRRQLTGFARIWAPLLWMLLAAGIALLAFWIIQNLPSLGFARRDEGTGGDTGGEPSDAPRAHEDPLQQADRLAAGGHFAEALHSLLAGGLAILQARLGDRLAASLTSREILHFAAVPDAGQPPLRVLISAVERTHFGEHRATAEDYRGCRDRFLELSHALAAPR